MGSSTSRLRSKRPGERRAINLSGPFDEFQIQKCNKPQSLTDVRYEVLNADVKKLIPPCWIIIQYSKGQHGGIKLLSAENKKIVLVWTHSIRLYIYTGKGTVFPDVK
jgi:hypothetical protein